MRARIEGRLTKKFIDALNPPDSGYIIAWDAHLKGFGCRVTAAGVKSFLVNYRSKGRERRITLGRYGAFSPDQARLLAAETLVNVAKGADPLNERRQLCINTTFAELADWYLERHAWPRKSATAAKEDARMLAVKLIPLWGRRAASDIRREQIVKLHNDLKNEIGLYTANRYIALLGKIFTLSIEWGVRDDNPARGIKRFPEDTRDRWLRPDEIRRMFEALAVESNPYVRGAIAFILLTGCRKGEALNARWEDIDFDARLWLIPKSKAQKPQTVPLSGQALAVLQGLPRIDKSPWVFPGEGGSKPLVNLSKPWIRVRHRAGLDDVRIHDLRRSLGSMMVQSGASLYVAQRALRHSDSRITSEVYAHLGENPTRAAFEAVGEKVAALMRPRNQT